VAHRSHIPETVGTHSTAMHLVKHRPARQMRKSAEVREPWLAIGKFSPEGTK